MRICEACFQYDDHPRIVIVVTPDGPLGLHSPAETAAVYQLVAADLPSNLAAIAALDGDEQLAAVRALPPEQQDAIQALADMEDVTGCRLHMDCYNALPADLKPDGVHVGQWAAQGVEQGLQGAELAQHLTSQPEPEEY
jgi:hypothetical protein